MAINASQLPALSPELAALLRENLAIVQIISIFAVGAYSALEVGIASLHLFKGHRGLYFFSMQAASWGILMHVVPAQILFINPSAVLALSIPFTIGWALMVIAHPMVLYSRLHLVVADISRFRWILWMIIFNAIAVGVPTIVFQFGAAFGSEYYFQPAAIIDQIQVTIFGAQDFIISAIYIREAHRALGPVIAIRGKDGKKVIYHLIAINVAIIILDVIVIAVTFKAPFAETSLKTVVYSQKVKFEFLVLNKLRSLVSSNTPYVWNAGIWPGNRDRDHTDDSSTAEARRRSSDLNVFAVYHMVSRQGPRDIEFNTPEPPSSTFEPDPFERSFRVSLQNHESRRARQRMSRMGSTPDFHQAIRETSSTENMPISPSPTMVSFNTAGSRTSQHVCPNGIDDRRNECSETKSTINAELLGSSK